MLLKTRKVYFLSKNYFLELWACTKQFNIVFTVIILLCEVSKILFFISNNTHFYHTLFLLLERIMYLIEEGEIDERKEMSHFPFLPSSFSNVET